MERNAALHWQVFKCETLHRDNAFRETNAGNISRKGATTRPHLPSPPVTDAALGEIFGCKPRAAKTPLSELTVRDSHDGPSKQHFYTNHTFNPLYPWFYTTNHLNLILGLSFFLSSSLN